MKTPLQIINEYKEAYERANGKGVIITYFRGWFTINGDRIKYRRKEIVSMTEVLKARPEVKDRMENVNGVLTLVRASQHVVQNLLSGRDVIEERDTPNCCSVASETYHSM